jgi:hypothetical protein
MANDQSGDVLSDAERAIAQRLIDEINEFNLRAVVSQSSTKCSSPRLRTMAS